MTAQQDQSRQEQKMNPEFAIGYCQMMLGGLGRELEITAVGQNRDYVASGPS